MMDRWCCCGLVPPCSCPRRCSTRPWTTVDPSPPTAIPTGIRLTEPRLSDPPHGEPDDSPREELTMLEKIRRNSVRRIVTFGPCALAVPMLVAAQTKDDFEYWDTNNNGDLT